MKLLDTVLSKDLTKPFNQVLKKLRKRLGPMRDLDVILGRLDKLQSPAAAVAWLREKLQDEQAKARKKVAGKPPKKILAQLGVWWALHPEMDEAGPAMDSLLGESVQRQLDEFHQRATAEPLDDPHPLRIAGKQLRYTLELAADHGRELPKEVFKHFEKLQDALGDWHDLVVFSEVVVQTSLDNDLPLHDPTTSREVLDLSKQTLAKAGRSLARFQHLWRADGERLSTAIRQAFGLPSEPQTDPGPSPTDAPPAPEVPTEDGLADEPV
jgi:CHAD domain-containing protein